MFGIEWLTIPILLGGISIVLGIVRFLWTRYWSRSAQAEKVLAKVERDNVRIDAERDRLEAETKRIDETPPKSGQALADALNKQTKKRRRLWPL